MKKPWNPDAQVQGLGVGTDRSCIRSPTPSNQSAYQAFPTHNAALK